MPAPYHANQYHAIILICFLGCICLSGSAYVSFFSLESKDLEIGIKFVVVVFSN